MKVNNLPSNSNEKFFKDKMVEYDALVKERNVYKDKIKGFKNTLKYLKDLESDKNVFKDELKKLKISSYTDICLCDYLNCKMITEDECPEFDFEYFVFKDKDMIINIIKAIIETYYQRYEDVNERIKNFDFLMGMVGIDYDSTRNI